MLHGPREVALGSEGKVVLIAHARSVTNHLAHFFFSHNYCFSPHGTAKVFRTVEWWHHLWPTNHTISDDIRNMYNEVDRRAAFAFLRKRFPELLPVARLFYGSNDSRIWFNGSLIHTDTSDGCLRCERGFAQGCPIATLMSIGAYHEELAELQRAHPGLRVVCDADDTYFNATGESIYSIFEQKRVLVGGAGADGNGGIHLCSKLAKVRCYSPEGDMRLAPADIPGSAHHKHGTLRGLKVVGAWVGDDEWCSEQVTRCLRDRLQPLDMVDMIRDSAAVSNSEQLRRSLLTRIAVSIPAYWLGLMRPSVTAAAAVFATARLSRSLERLYNFEGTATLDAGRASLARRQAFLPRAVGGLNLRDFVRQRTSIYAATSYAVWPTLTGTIPALASVDLAADPASLDAPAAAFATAYAACLTAHSAVADAYRPLDARRHHHVTGGCRPYFRPKSYCIDRTFPALSDLYADRTAGTIVHPSQRALGAAIDHEAYIGWWSDVSAFDASNAGACIPNREARRLVSVGQPLAADWLAITPDRSRPATSIASAVTRFGVERRLGLYPTDAQAVYDARAAAGLPVTESDRLGDTLINTTSKTGRHNLFNRACRDALAATTTHEVILGDKGDGKPRARAAALQRYAWANDGHVTDIIHKHAAANGNHELFESKVYTAARKSNNKGNGTARGGGSPSTSHGHLVAFGCTEEALIVENVGCRARGAPGDGAFNHSTGDGWVQPKRGCYHDGIVNKKNELKLLIADPHGGVTPSTFAWLAGLGARAKTGRDATVYGDCSPRAFVAHHGACMSLACVRGEHDTFRKGLDGLERTHTAAGAA